MSSPSRSKSKPLSQAGMRLTERDVSILTWTFQLRGATADQVHRLLRHEIHCRSVCQRRLGLLRRHGFLYGERIPTHGSVGTLPFRYVLGRQAVRTVSERLGLDAEFVRRRQRQDERLSVLFNDHRLLGNDFRIALTLACQARGYGLLWQTDEELAAMRLTARVEGKALPVRPDGFFVIDRGAGKGRSAFMLEVQLVSKPSAYKRKAEAAMAFFASGAYTEAFAQRSLRVLGLTTSRERALNLQDAAEAVGGTSLFWSASAADVLAAPLGARVWFMGGSTQQQALFEDE